MIPSARISNCDNGAARCGDTSDVAASLCICTQLPVRPSSLAARQAAKLFGRNGNYVQGVSEASERARRRAI
eukprot:10015974-Alexandrium_andersonii.AAC.1